jgi:antirestriction protein ArdC
MNVYDIVTNRITELLEQGTVPWRRPWRSTEGPRNLISKKPYRGINSFLLNASPYESDYWLTYNQAKQKGGSVRKGEKSTLVVFWKWLDRKESDSTEVLHQLHLVHLLVRFRFSDTTTCSHSINVKESSHPKSQR